MSDPIFKLSDVKAIKELASVLTYPLVAVAYFLQTGPVIRIDDDWHWSLAQSADTPLGMLLIMFMLKAVYACFLLFLVDAVIRVSEWKHLNTALYVLATMFMSIGLLGLLASDVHPALSRVNRFWFVSSLVWGFACLQRVESNS